MFDEKDLISTYTRKEALADGVQVSMEELGKQHLAGESGYIWPVYMTEKLWNLMNETAERPTNHSSVDGILWDIFYMSIALKKMVDPRTALFTVRIGKKNYQLQAQAGPVDIDDPAPCVTFSFPGE